MQKYNTADTVAATIGSDDFDSNASFCSLNERTPDNSSPPTPKQHPQPTPNYKSVPAFPLYSSEAFASRGIQYRSSPSVPSSPSAASTFGGGLISHGPLPVVSTGFGPLVASGSVITVSDKDRRKWVPASNTVAPCNLVCREPTSRPRDPPPPKPPPYYTQDLSSGFVEAPELNTTRYMPPPPPSMQLARTIAVALGEEQPPLRNNEQPDGRTCPAEGEFAFLAKTPGTSDWVRGGYGATYAATMAEGAPAESFTQVDIHDESFQSLLRVMMRWYVRVAGLFGCVSPSSATSDAPSVNVAAARSHLRPSERLPRSYFARTAVPPCPSPFAYFTTAEQGDLHVVSDLQAFVAWHDAVHGWWDMHVRPRSVGYGLHMQLYRKGVRVAKQQMNKETALVSTEQ